MEITRNAPGTELCFGNELTETNGGASKKEIGNGPSTSPFDNLSVSTRPASAPVALRASVGTKGEEKGIGSAPAEASIVARQASMDTLLPEIVQLIASFLPVGATLRLGETSRSIRSNLRPYLDLLSAQGRSRHTATLAEFSALLHDKRFERPLPTVDGKIPACRGEVLATLGSRITSLPENEQEQARESFIGVAEQYEGRKPANFERIVGAAKQGIETLRETCLDQAREQCRAPTCTTPDAVRCIAAENGITGDEDIAILRETAAQVEVMREKNVAHVAETFGLSPEASARLQSFAVDCPHIREALNMGTGHGQVAYHYGIHDSDALEALKFWGLQYAIGGL